MHNEIFNTDYVVIGCYQARQEIASHIDDLFCCLEQYQDEFGEIYRDIADVERVLNLMFYMCGQEIFSDISLFEDDTKWNGIIDNDDLKLIIKEIRGGLY